MVLYQSVGKVTFSGYFDLFQYFWRYYISLAKQDLKTLHMIITLETRKLHRVIRKCLKILKNTSFCSVLFWACLNKQDQIIPYKEVNKWLFCGSKSLQWFWSQDRMPHPFIALSSGPIPYSSNSVQWRNRVNQWWAQYLRTSKPILTWLHG